MGLFSSKNPAGPTDAAPDSWTMVQGTHGGNLLLARVRTDLGALVGHAAYPFRIGVATPVHQLAANGMPTSGENATLLELERQLAAALEAERHAILVVALTTNGVKEWVFYATDPKAIQQRFEAFAPTVRTHRLQMVIEKDPGWVVYHQFVDGK